MSENNSTSAELESSGSQSVGYDSAVLRLSSSSNLRSVGMTELFETSTTNRTSLATVTEFPDTSGILPKLTTEDISAINSVARNYGLDDAISCSVATGNSTLGRSGVANLLPDATPKVVIMKSVATQVSILKNTDSDADEAPVVRGTISKSITTQIYVEDNPDYAYGSARAAAPSMSLRASSISDVMSWPTPKGIKMPGLSFDREAKTLTIFGKRDPSRGPISFSSSPSEMLSRNAGSMLAVSEIGVNQAPKALKLLNRGLLNAIDFAGQQMLSPRFTMEANFPTSDSKSLKSKGSQAASMAGTINKDSKFMFQQMASPNHLVTNKLVWPSALSPSSLQAVRGSPKHPANDSSFQQSKLDETRSVGTNPKLRSPTTGTLDSEVTRDELRGGAINRPSNIAVCSSSVNMVETPSPSLVVDDQLSHRSNHASAIGASVRSSTALIPSAPQQYSSNRLLQLERPQLLPQTFVVQNANAMRSSHIAVRGTSPQSSNALSSQSPLGSLTLSTMSRSMIRPSARAVRGSEFPSTTLSAMSNNTVADCQFNVPGHGSTAMTSMTQVSNAAFAGSSRSQHLTLLSPSMNPLGSQSPSMRSNVGFYGRNARPSTLAVRGTQMTSGQPQFNRDIGYGTQSIGTSLSDAFDRRTSDAAVRGTGLFSAPGSMFSHCLSSMSGTPILRGSRKDGFPMGARPSTAGICGSAGGFTQTHESCITSKHIAGGSRDNDNATNFGITTRPRAISFADCVPSIHVFRHDEFSDAQRSNVAVEDGTSQNNMSLLTNAAFSQVSTQPAVETQPTSRMSKQSGISEGRIDIPISDGDMQTLYSNVNVQGSVFSDTISTVRPISLGTRTAALPVNSAADRILFRGDQSPKKTETTTNSPRTVPHGQFLQPLVTQLRTPITSPTLQTCDLTLQTPHLYSNDARTEDGSIFDVRFREQINLSSPFSLKSVPLTVSADGWMGRRSGTSSDRQSDGQSDGQSDQQSAALGQSGPSADRPSMAMSVTTWLRNAKK
eukprot:GEMP01008100.1.p1 GENE.GEMP01008100.1~~GEMP01008100.1.p1  ORF type:complete len:1007 (+),score=153.23 GEMP01008100.1:146-3166(+)